MADFFLFFFFFFFIGKKKVFVCSYSKCPKISDTRVFDKMAYANSVDPDQTAPEGAVWSGSTLFDIPQSILRNDYIKIKILLKKYAIKRSKFWILG